MTLQEARCTFAWLLLDLLTFANENGFVLALDEGMQHQNKGHMKDSLHYSGCAQDVLLYDINGRYLTGESDETGFQEYKILGDFWKTLHPHCRWGGDFPGDPGHFSFAPPELFGGRA